MAQATQMQAVSVLSQDDVLTKLRTTVHPAAAQQYFAEGFDTADLQAAE